MRTRFIVGESLTHARTHAHTPTHISCAIQRRLCPWPNDISCFEPTQPQVTGEDVDVGVGVEVGVDVAL